MRSLDYLHLQMKLEGIALGAGGLLSRLAPGDDEPPLMLLARTAEGDSAAYLSNALPPDLCRALIEGVDGFAFPHIGPFLERIRSCGIPCRASHYRTYVFLTGTLHAATGPAKCFPHDDPAVTAFGFMNLPGEIYAVEEAGIIVSACASSRQNAECAKAWVFTAPEHRGRGLAQAVVTGWAKALLSQNVVPFYSHEVTNLASANVARKLGLIQVFEEINIEKEK